MGCKAITTRRGDSSGPYGVLNACHYKGDDPAHVELSRRVIASVMGCDISKLVIPRQSHSCNVAVLRRGDNMDASLDNIDAVVTDREDVALCVNTADCVPILLCDQEAGVAAAVHSGWRGTVRRIARNAVDAMIELGAVPDRISAVMGPCICKQCFEVGQEVADAFLKEFALYGDVVLLGGDVKPHIDLSAAVRHTLIELGLDPDNIVGPVACSHCDGGKEFFSARTLGIHSGRTLTAVRLLSTASV